MAPWLLILPVLGGPAKSIKLCLRVAQLDQRVLALIQMLLEGCSMDQTITCQARKDKTPTGK